MNKTEYPRWRKNRCVHCAAGMPMITGTNRHAAGFRTTARCTAPPIDEYFADLQTMVHFYEAGVTL